MPKLTELLEKISPTPWTRGPRGDVIDANGYLISVSGIAQPHGYIPPEDVSFANGELLAMAPALARSHEALKVALAKMVKNANWEEVPANEAEFDAMINESEVALAEAEKVSQ